MEATIVSLEGRMYPVEVAYLKEVTPDYVRKAAEVAWNIHLQVGSHLPRFISTHTILSKGREIFWYF